MNDPFGEAIKDYFVTGKAARLIVNSNYTDDEEIPVSYLFRTEKQMPEIEQTALKHCTGKVLDVGAAAGCHSIVLQKKRFDVTALEISEIAAEIIHKRGVKKVVCQNIYTYSGTKFNTILLLMNGTGIGQTIKGLKKLFLHLKTLLDADGQILIDSSDIKYLFEEEDGSIWIDISNPKYYGEMEYEVSYKTSTSTFKWLFVDYVTLAKLAKDLGFSCTLLETGEHFEYLAQLKIT